MVEDWVIKTMYATKRRRRTVKSVKAPVKDPPKSNPSKRHRERLNSELDHLASLLPFEQSVISKLDKLSVLRLAVSYLRTKSYFQSVLPARYGIESHLMTRAHLFHEPNFSEGDSILQALYGFLFVVTCEGEVFFASRTVEQYLGFHQSDIIHQSVMELIHSEDREEFKRQLTWNSMLPQDKANISLHEIMLPDNMQHLHRSFTVRFRCLLDNTSGFITLELNGWIRVLHGQSPRSEEPQLALFATCSPFGPLSLFDIPSRELTFKSKHKMDFSPLTMDNRGKMMFGFTEQEMSVKSGYDLIHPDDLAYFSSAHQELIKTGSSGLIAYRWLTKSYRWMWLQSSCKVIYKNSKPDFIICTHRQLTDDEGQDLFTKRGNEFKLPYPLLDLDMCSGFGFGDEELGSKTKSSKSKKKSGQNKDCVQNGKKRKGGATPTPTGCLINGIAGYGPAYAPLNAYETAPEFKPADFLYPYGTNSYGFDTADLYRSHAAYGSFGPSVYPSVDTYRLDSADKHGLSNGYFLDHRQYQPALPYASNSYTDVMASSAKYGYDVTKYGFDSYSLDLSKRMGCGEEVPPPPHPHSHPPPPPPPHPPHAVAPPHMEADVRGKFGHDFHQHHDRYTPRFNGTGLEPVDLRSSSMFAPNSFIEGAVAPPCVTSALFKGMTQTPSNLLQKDPKLQDKSPSGLMAMSSSSSLPALPSSDLIPVMTLGQSSVIKSTSMLQDGGLPSMPCNVSTSLSLGSASSSQTPPNIHPPKVTYPSAGSPWGGVCVAGGPGGAGGIPTPNNTVSSPNQHDLRDDLGQGVNMNGTQGDQQQTQQHHQGHGGSSPKAGGIPASVIQSRVCDKQSGMGGIPVPVVKSSATWHFNNNNHTTTNNNSHLQMEREWGPPQDYFATKPFRSHLTDGYQHVKVDVL